MPVAVMRSVTEVTPAPSGGLLVASEQGLPGSDTGARSTEVRFYGPDLAVSVGGSEPGIGYGFIRDGGRVTWMRAAGQIARRTP